MNTSIPETIGSFRIQGKIGQGGMGAVYRAVHGTLERPVALKVLPSEFANNPEYVTRFLREARTIATLRHENIVQVYDAGEINGQYFIAMELVEGSNLGTYADDHRPVDEKAGLELLLQAAKGLDAAHGKGLVHRDIKPENLLLSGDKTLRIVDFGLVMESTSTTQLTATGACLGTPMYMSPEQADGENADSRTDIYSLGVTFYRVFTGQTPFTSATVMNLLFKHKFEAPPDPRTLRADLSVNVSNLLLHMLAKRREERPQTAQKLIEMLELIRQGKNVPPPPTFAPLPSGIRSNSALEQTIIATPSSPGSRRYRGVPYLGIAVICLVLAVLITTVYLLGRNPASLSQAAQNGETNAAETAHLEKAVPDPLPSPDSTRVVANTGSRVDDAIARGDKAFDAGNLKSAIDEYKIGLVSDPQNSTLLLRIKKTENTILYKSAMDSGAALEASGRWEEAAKQYTAAKPYGDGAQTRIDAVNKKISEQQKLESTSKSSALEVATQRAEEAEKNLMFDKAAEHYSRAATLAAPPLRSVLADKAQECRRQDYIAQGKAAEALMDYADAEIKYKKALAIRDDPLVADKVEAMAQKSGPSATLSAPDKPATERDRRDAMTAARAALTSGNLALARQKIELAKKAAPNNPDTIALSAEIDARELMLQAATAANGGDKNRAVSLYRQALTVDPDLSGEIAPRLNAVLGGASTAPVNTDKIDALVRELKDDDATTEIGNALRGTPNSAGLQQVRDALEQMRYAYWIYHQLALCVDKSRRMASDAIDLDDDDRNKAERVKLKKMYEELTGKEQQVRQTFLSHDYAGVQTMLAAARADAIECSSKLTNQANYFETRAEKAEKGLKIGFVGINTDSKKAIKYRTFVDEIRRNAEEAKNLKRYGER